MLDKSGQYQSGLRRPQLPLDDAGRPAAARREAAEVDDAGLVRVTQSLLQRRRVGGGDDEDEADARVERPHQLVVGQPAARPS